MCGICGMIGGKDLSRAKEKVGVMADSMSHRGPDDKGVYVSQKSDAVLGHRRLSIIDLSPLGHQPMSNEDGSLWIVLNGEIYNYVELREALQARGHSFRSHSDTEAVLHLYEEYGEECVKHLRGMFSFAILNEKDGSLFAARDRAGKKPFLYSASGGRFVFASEFSAILASGAVDKEIDPVSLNYYLTFGYIPSPRTIYKGVLKLPPAHTLVFRNGEVSVKRYWQLDYSNKIKISEEDAASEIIRLMRESVRIRLRSDVPVGAFLSGGIDSSAIVAMMSLESTAKVKTFSIGFEEKAYNELVYARAVAEKYSTDHHEFIVKPDALKVLPELIERYGEPYADSSCIPTYYVCNETRKYVTVALNGDGGDELFAGYERYQAILASEIYHRLPQFIRFFPRSLAGMLPDSADPKNKLRRIKRFFDGIDLPLAERYLRWAGIAGKEILNGLYSAEFARAVSYSDPVDVISPYLDRGGIDTLDKILSADTNTYLPDDLLVKVDIASMANSLEARSPLLDHKIMEFAASLPVQYKIKGSVKKYILKKAVKGLIPDDNIYRGKMGFGVPVGRWFRNELQGFLRDSILSGRALGRGYFNAEALRGMVEAHVSGRSDHTFRLWSLLVLELWHKRFID